MGDTLLVPASWAPIRNNGNPFEFDNVAFQHRKGIHFLQYCPPEAIMVFGKTNRKSSFLGGVHNWCNLQLRTYVHDTATLGLLQAMLLGDDSSFDPELRQAYAQTGVIHIVSISGSHVAVLFLVISGLLFWMKGSRGKWIKYGLGVALVWVYVLMAGAPPSAVRSAIMFTVIALGVVTSNEGHNLNTLLAAAFALLLAEPAWIFSVGFQLSFGAVLSMLLFYSPIYRLWPQQSWIGKKSWQAVSASLSAEILTAPLVIYYFHNFPLVFIVANLLSAVLIGLCALVGGLAIIAFCWIAPLAHGIGWLVVYLVTIFNKAVTWLQTINPASFQYLQITVAELLTIYVIISAAAFLLLRRRKSAVFTMLFASCVLLALLLFDQFITLRQERLIVYNNGRHPLVEVIRGDRFKTLPGSSTASAYAANAAHIGMHAWHKEDLNMSGPCASINGKNVLVLSDTGTNVWHTQWPVDVLVLCRPLRGLMPDKILHTFRPRQLVLASNPGDYQLRKWEDSCRAAGVPLHAVSVSGAYILE
jgi:competence protein ComEC